MIESVVFPELEREALHQLDNLLYDEHLATMNALTGQDFEEERRAAREVYTRTGRRLAPWLRWTPEKTVVDMWKDEEERRKDPTYMATLRRLQSELDDRAEAIKKAVQTELEIRKAAQKDRERREAESKRTGGRRHVRVPWRSRPIR